MSFLVTLMSTMTLSRNLPHVRYFQASQLVPEIFKSRQSRFSCSRRLIASSRVTPAAIAIESSPVQNEYARDTQEPAMVSPAQISSAKSAPRSLVHQESAAVPMYPQTM